jgi:hypothetical protein
MKVNRQWFRNQGACQDGYQWVCSQLTGSEEIEVKDLINKLIGEDKFSWASWTIVRVFNRSQKLRYALYAAKSVLNIFEEKYPEDKRPANAIQLVEKYIEDENSVSQEELIAARRAADAALAASTAACTAACTAAYVAAYAAALATSTAYAAAYTADAYVADAAADAAYAAADALAFADAPAYARKEQYKQILTYGLTLIKESL